MASTNLKSIGAAAALALTLGLGVASPAGAVDTYTPSSEITVSNPTPKAGQSITLSGKTTPNTAVTVTITAGSSTQSLNAAAATTITLGSTTSDANGDYSLTVTVPADLPAGNYILAASAGGTVISSSNLAVAAPAPTQTTTTTAPEPEKLAFTGSESAPMAGIALAVIGTGGALVLLARRKNDGADITA